MRVPGISLPTTVAIIAGIGLFVGMPLLDYDYFWHHKTGEWIVTHGWTLPTAEPFSFTVAGSHWVVQGWLFDALQYLTQREFGNHGVQAVFALLTVATWALVYASVRLYIAEQSRALLLTVLCACAASPFLAPRPLAATNLAFAFVFFALLKHRASGRAMWLAGIPVVFALWINLHFGYVTGLSIVALFALASLTERALPISNAPLEPGRLTVPGAAALLAASVGALVINPYGWEAVSETIRMTRINAVTDVVDWLSPDFRDPSRQIFLLPLGLLFFARALASRRAQWLDLLAPLAVVGVALHSQRNIPLTCIALAPLIARAFAAWEPGTIRNALPASVLAGWRSTAGKDDVPRLSHRRVPDVPTAPAAAGVRRRPLQPLCGSGAARPRSGHRSTDGVG